MNGPIKYWSILLMIFLAIPITETHSQPPPPPSHGQSENQPVSAGAPVAGGVDVIILLSLGYAGITYYRKRRQR
jgi:hypothetical protein